MPRLMRKLKCVLDLNQDFFVQKNFSERTILVLNDAFLSFLLY